MSKTLLALISHLQKIFAEMTVCSADVHMVGCLGTEEHAKEVLGVSKVACAEDVNAAIGMQPREKLTIWVLLHIACCTITLTCSSAVQPSTFVTQHACLHEPSPHLKCYSCPAQEGTGSLPIVGFKAKLVACSGRPYTCCTCGKLRSKEMASGPWGLLSVWLLKISCHQPSGSPSYICSGP